ncbi:MULTISPECIES: potassium channel family protein [Aliivibrio]|nr:MULTISPECIES: potassium channel family protein [Aliivibrio]MDD9180749.1 potassium channel family protein [Aliivibrio sp. A6]
MKIKYTSAFWWLLSPTYKYAELNKNKLIENGACQTELSSALKKYNKRYFISAIIICIAVQSLTYLGQTLFPESGFSAHPLIKYPYWAMAIIIIWLFLLSRGIEITKAFLGDAIDKLNGEHSNSDLKYGERLKLALTSYIELIINFGTLYFLMPLCFYKDSHQFSSIFEAIYFSGITITTVGYGDISPSYWLLQFLTVFEVLAGFSLIVVCFTIYSSLALSQPEICKICGKKLKKRT